MTGLVICTAPQCQTSAGCICSRTIGGTTMSSAAPDSSTTYICGNCGGHFRMSAKPNFCPYCRAPDPKEPDPGPDGKIHNVKDGRHGWTGSWEVEPLIYDELTAADVGRTVIYQDHGRAEAGTLSSYRDRRIWARFSRGDTAAACDPHDLCFGVRPLDGDLSRGERVSL